MPSITGFTTTFAVNPVKNEIRNVTNPVKKQIIIQKYQTLRLNVSPHLIIIRLQVKYLK